jgi:hypothetical protein
VPDFFNSLQEVGNMARDFIDAIEEVVGELIAEQLGHQALLVTMLCQTIGSTEDWQERLGS